MFIISCFHFDTEKTAIYTLGIPFFIMDTGYIAATISNNTGNFFELPGFVYQFNQKTGGTTGIEKSAVNHA